MGNASDEKFSLFYHSLAADDPVQWAGFSFGDCDFYSFACIEFENAWKSGELRGFV